MCFGFVPNIIVSSPEAAKQFLKTHDLNFASRPSLEAAKHITYEGKSLTFATYGPYWRNMRKLCTLELLSNLKINSFQAMRKKELSELVNILEDAAQEQVAVDLSSRITSMSSDVSCQMVFWMKFEDKEFDERGFGGVIQEGMKMAVAFNLGDYFPYIGALDLQGMTRKMKDIAKVWDQFLEKILDDHDKPKEHGQTKDFVDTMLGILKSGDSEFEFDRSHIKAILMDMFSASAETSATTIEWTLSELLRHPRVMKKAQKELEQVVGLNKMVEESDLESRGTWPHEAAKYISYDQRNLSFGAYGPYLSVLDLQGLTKRMKAVAKVFDKFLEKILDEHAIPKDPGQTKDFVDTMLDIMKSGVADFEFDRTHIKAVLLDMLAAAVDTAATTVDWTMSELLKNPQIMKKVQNELAEVIGMDKMVDESDLASLEYLDLPLELDMTEEFGLVVTRANHLKATPSYRLHLN
ncbi:hypothetical protein POM88_037769 [Heracleum sosnowskyi]|uniref:Cytochrome P450 n=1 Tax=Heracleum sosnowskyi TaxID=360622 RepID=A0AAD8HQQ2_9APIA|nr:hypothetical protein POM88_037769 [Heracleum sosnowskyi]